MYFRKQPFINNFDFLTKYRSGKPCTVGHDRMRVTVTPHRDGIFRLKVEGPRWKKNYSQAQLKRPAPQKQAAAKGPSIQVDDGFGIKICDEDGHVLLTSPSKQTFGVSGTSSMFVFNQEDNHEFYGMGEKMRGLELSGIQTKFWNTDVFGDFHWKEIENDRPDPMYVSIPYLIIKRDNRYVGLLLDNPYATFMSTSPRPEIGGGQMIVSGSKDRFITIGAEHGQPDLYILTGPSLAELTRKLQHLVGRTPLPPAWALGYHQCRWGYKADTCLKRLDEGFRKHGIPCDGLWLDIDYMDSFKVFTFNKQHFPALHKTLSSFEKSGRKILPILDPGVKQESGYPVYESGRKADVFCRNPQNREYVGLVWPGETVFPDYSMPAGRKWWADHVTKFARNGIYGAWLDMNDPSTGPVRCLDMRFNRGKDSHYTYHNQYALGMARATRDGFTAAHPNKRPFLLSRSGYTGISKYAALWTGDNMSNYHYLRNSIAVSLNLALSGVPFNGPDIGGFAGDTSDQLIQDWMKTCFLFPFCRNHSMIGTRDQEPWAFKAATRNVLKHYIQLRYKLRPYLYNLFVHQEERGEAILRPLFYDFEDSVEKPLGRIDDQFLVGPALMQAPLLSEDNRERSVVLPGSQAWYSALDGAWLSTSRNVKVTPSEKQTPLYVREDAIIPMTPGALPTDNAYDGKRVEFHVFVRNAPTRTVTYEYTSDDGTSFDYQKGKRSRMQVKATVSAKEELEITTDMIATGYGHILADFVLYDDFKQVRVNGKSVKPKRKNWSFCGVSQKTWRISR